MRFTLTDYQYKAVEDLVAEVDEARIRFTGRNRPTAIGLAAPTGAGKTVMATALLEELFNHDPNLTVIWLSDAPELNRQSERKILLASTEITPLQIRNLTELDQATLDPGTITFAHIQALGKGATSMHATNVGKDGTTEVNEARTHGVWDMLSTTMRSRGKDVVVIIDEAHRGTGNGSQVSGSVRKTIFSTIIHGGISPSGVTVPLAPIVVGISATPERFHAAMNSPLSRHNLITVQTDLALVRSSGLLKDVIDVPRPAEEQKADHTLIEQAVHELQAITHKWTQYHDETGAPLVEPCMVIQVPAGVSKPEIDAICDTLEKTWPVLADKAVAHTFESHAPIKVGHREVRWIAPSDIASPSSGVRAVLFKSALTTGWDCPRAEVMVSLRTSNEPTTIAQLIGRMVRTPLARRVEDGDESLNAVTLYLPHYDAAAVAEVVDALTKDEDTKDGGTDVRVATQDCSRNDQVPAKLFDLLASLPSAARPPRRFKDASARARYLAGRLLDHELAEAPNVELDAVITGAMRTAYDVRAAAVDKAVVDILTFSLQRSSLTLNDMGGFTATEALGKDVSLAERDLVRSFDKAVRALPDSAAMLYYKTLENPDDRADRARIIVLADIPEVGNTVDKACRDQISSWKDKYFSAVERLPREAQIIFAGLWSPDDDVVQTTVALPDVMSKVATATLKIVDGKKMIVDLERHRKHLFSLPGTDDFPVKYGSNWEKKVLLAELKTKTVLGWYRNPPRGQHALAVPYVVDGASELMHPDFLFFRDAGEGEVVVDVIDPHMHSSADTAPKWRGLAQWATMHGGQPWLGRVVAVIEDSMGNLRALNLRDSKVAEVLAVAATKADIETLFGAHGFAY